MECCHKHTHTQLCLSFCSSCCEDVLSVFFALAGFFLYFRLTLYQLTLCWLYSVHHFFCFRCWCPSGMLSRIEQNERADVLFCFGQFRCLCWPNHLKFQVFPFNVVCRQFSLSLSHIHNWSFGVVFNVCVCACSYLFPRSLHQKKNTIHTSSWSSQHRTTQCIRIYAKCINLALSY